MDDQQRLQRRALSIFEELLDYRSSQRYEQATAACSGDTALLGEVRRLLRADDKVRLAIPTRDPNSAAVPFPFQPDSALLWVGRRIGAFEIEKVVGGGGMGLVFLAKRVDGEVRQQVAIKVMRAVLATSELAARFDREQQILANLRHPNIASFLDAGATEEGLPFVVMEYVDGTPINAYIEQRACSVQDIIALFLDVCSAVETAHQALVVHRDIKPGNILVDDSGRPKLLDFGIAKDLADEDAAGTVVLPLTPAYASPEQIRRQPVRTASDVYSLGVVLYECLTGRRPYEVDELSPAEVEREITQVAPARPSAFMEPRTTGNARDLDAIVLKAMDADISRRYASAGALRDDLLAFLDGRVVSARLATPVYRASRFVQRHLVAVVLAVVALVSLVAGLAVSITKTVEAETQLARSQAVSGYMKDILLSVDPTWNPAINGGAGTTMGDVLAAAEVQLDEDLFDQPLVRIDLYDVLGEAQMWMNNRDAAVRTREKARALTETVFPEGAFEVAFAIAGVAEAHDDFGESHLSLPLYEEAIALLTAAHRREVIYAAHILNDAAVAYGNVRQYVRALHLQEEAIDAARSSNDAASPNWLNYHGNRGRFLLELGRLDEAEAALNTGLASVEGSGAPSYYTARFFSDLGRVHLLRGDHRSAEQAFARSLALAKANTDEHIETGVTVVLYSLWETVARQLQGASADLPQVDPAKFADDPDAWIYHLAGALQHALAARPEAARTALAAAERTLKIGRPRPTDLSILALVSERVRS